MHLYNTEGNIYNKVRRKKQILVFKNNELLYFVRKCTFQICELCSSSFEQCLSDKESTSRASVLRCGHKVLQLSKHR